MRTVWTLDDAEATRLIEQEKLSVIQVAQKLGVSRQAVHHAIRRGRIPAPPTARLGDSAASAADGTTTPQPAA